MWQGALEWLGYGNEAPLQQTEQPKIWAMTPEVQQTLCCGTKYKMKVVIRGARGVGKTALFHRLQGKPVPPQYEQSLAIEATTIRWHPQRTSTRLLDGATEDIVTIDVWDVVDVGAPINQAQSTIAEIAGAPPNDLLPPLALDASTVDVYRQCNCVLFLFDITRRETFQYVVSELRKVPPGIAVLICANFFDQQANRVVSDSEIAELCSSIPPTVTPFVASLTRAAPDPAVCGRATFIHLSLTTGYGLRPLHAFLNIPFSFVVISLAEKHLSGLYQSLHNFYTELGEIRERQDYEQYCNWMKAGGEMSRRAIEKRDQSVECDIGASKPTHRERKKQGGRVQSRDVESLDADAAPMEEVQLEGFFVAQPTTDQLSASSAPTVTSCTADASEVNTTRVRTRQRKQPPEVTMEALAYVKQVATEMEKEIAPPSAQHKGTLENQHPRHGGHSGRPAKKSVPSFDLDELFK